MISRRSLVTGVFSLPIGAAAAESEFAWVEQHGATAGVAARIGVAALDTGSGKYIAWRGDERFLMCSTFKLSLVAATLAKADSGHENLARMVHYDADVPIGVSPAIRKNIASGMTVAQLCEAAVVYSDNGAANLLLDRLGGPKALTHFWRSIGDQVTRLDDIEPRLNIPDGARNTTTPAAMMGNLKTLLLGDALSPASRGFLLVWMRASTTGAKRLRTGLPIIWQWGDKTRTSDPRYRVINDIGIATPPGRSPLLMVAYTERSTEYMVGTVGQFLAKAFG
jgi:beta-lactamase class A